MGGGRSLKITHKNEKGVCFTDENKCQNCVKNEFAHKLIASSFEENL